MSTSNLPMIIPSKRAWNPGRITNQKRPLLPNQAWAIRVRLDLEDALAISESCDGIVHSLRLRSARPVN